MTGGKNFFFWGGARSVNTPLRTVPVCTRRIPLSLERVWPAICVCTATRGTRRSRSRRCTDQSCAAANVLPRGRRRRSAHRSCPLMRRLLLLALKQVLSSDADVPSSAHLPRRSNHRLPPSARIVSALQHNYSAATTSTSLSLSPSLCVLTVIFQVDLG